MHLKIRSKLRLELLRMVLFTLALFTCTSAFPGASTIIGSNDAQRCYQESLFPFSDQGIGYCNNAILRGELTRTDLAATYSNRGIIHSKIGKFEKAMADHDQAIRLKPDMPAVHINRGNALYLTHEYEEALTEFDKAIATNAGLIATALFNKALTLLKLHRLNEAIVTLETALEADPDSKKIEKTLNNITSLSEPS